MIYAKVLTPHGWVYPGDTETVATLDENSSLSWRDNVNFKHFHKQRLIQVRGTHLDYICGPNTSLSFNKARKVRPSQAKGGGATCVPGRLTTDTLSALYTSWDRSPGNFVRWCNVTHPANAITYIPSSDVDAAIRTYLAQEIRDIYDTRVLTSEAARPYRRYLDNRPQFPGLIFNIDKYPLDYRMGERAAVALLEHIHGGTLPDKFRIKKGNLDLLQAAALHCGYRAAITEVRGRKGLNIKKVSAGPIVGPSVKFNAAIRDAWASDTPRLITRHNGRVRIT